jgi:hypothetical protein
MERGDPTLLRKGLDDLEACEPESIDWSSSSEESPSSFRINELNVSDRSGLVVAGRDFVGVSSSLSCEDAKASKKRSNKIRFDAGFGAASSFSSTSFPERCSNLSTSFPGTGVMTSTAKTRGNTPARRSPGYESIENASWTISDFLAIVSSSTVFSVRVDERSSESSKQPHTGTHNGCLTNETRRRKTT